MKDRKELKSLLQEALIFKETTLASGKNSPYYIDARLVTLSARGALLVAKTMMDFLREFKIDAVGGLTLGADPIVSALAIFSALQDEPIGSFIVRKEPKTHGREKLIEGPSIKGLKVAVIDDVVTTGNSLLKAAKAAGEAEADVVMASALVDRAEGATEKLKKNNIEFKPIFQIKELLN